MRPKDRADRAARMQAAASRPASSKARPSARSRRTGAFPKIDEQDLGELSEDTQRETAVPSGGGHGRNMVLRIESYRRGHDEPSREAPVVRLEASQGPPSVAPRMGDLSGERNQNPPDVGLLELIAEDFRVHDRKLTEPGFWALAVHRFGNWRMDVQPKTLRAPLSAVYRTLHTGVNLLFGIDLGYSTRVGRRVRIWHHGGMVLSARSIGNEVHIRHNTTFGVSRRGAPVHDKPIIGDRVEVGVGAVVVGPITVGHDSVIGANAVVVRDCPPRSTLVGVPARPRRAIPTEPPHSAR